MLRLVAHVKGLNVATAPEGYLLDVTNGQVTAKARTRHGLFNAVQTIRQLLPAAIDAPTVQDVDWTMPAAHVLDYPRFGYRGFMLDIA